jgi:hypothetical protein
VWLVSSIRLLAIVHTVDGVAVRTAATTELDAELRSLLGRRLSVVI